MQLLLFLVTCVAVFAYCAGKDCKKRDRCKCVFDDDSGMLDIWDMARTDGMPLFYDFDASSDKYAYSFNPCYGFTEESCTDVSVCQYDQEYGSSYELGMPEKVDFSYDGTNVVATYTSQDGSRNTYVTLVCDPAATDASIDVQGEIGYLKYYMTVTSASACPLPYSSNLLSAGTVILIIFLGLIVVYLLAGVVFNKVKRQAAGKDLVPNRDFWLMVPGLIKEVTPQELTLQK